MGRRRWSLRPIESLAKEVRELEEHHREKLNPNTTRELTRLVSNLNRRFAASANAMTNTALPSPISLTV
nr:Sensor protein PhoQ [Klebsiella pneumoniae]